ncbi:MAG: hypothetical protein ACREFR_07210 [Limisphaerales bacterium]
MRDESDLERLQRRVEKSKVLLHQSEMKVEELEASIRKIDSFKDRVFIFSARPKQKLQREQAESAQNVWKAV